MDISMTTPEPSPPIRRFNWRRLFQFRLRTILILTTIIAVWLGWWSYKARQQREAVAALRKAGATVEYHFQMRGFQRPQNYPAWLVDALGVDYFATVHYVGLDYREVTDADLEHLHKLTTLKLLNLRGTQVTDAGVARLKKSLPDCYISR